MVLNCNFTFFKGTKIRHRTIEIINMVKTTIIKTGKISIKTIMLDMGINMIIREGIRHLECISSLHRITRCRMIPSSKFRMVVIINQCQISRMRTPINNGAQSKVRQSSFQLERRVRRLRRRRLSQRISHLRLSQSKPNLIKKKKVKTKKKKCLKKRRLRSNSQ